MNYEVKLDGSKCFGWQLGKINQFWFHQRDVFLGHNSPSVIRLYSPKTGHYKKFINSYSRWHTNGDFSRDFLNNPIRGLALTYREEVEK